MSTISQRDRNNINFISVSFIITMVILYQTVWLLMEGSFITSTRICYIMFVFENNIQFQIVAMMLFYFIIIRYEIIEKIGNWNEWTVTQISPKSIFNQKISSESLLKPLQRINWEHVRILVFTTISMREKKIKFVSSVLSFVVFGSSCSF